MAESHPHRVWFDLRFGVIPALLLSYLSACADDPPPPAANPASSPADAGTVAPAAALPPLPRSSIAAVIQHRVELGLSDDQVRDLELRDQEREKEDAAIRDEIEKKRKQAQDARAAAGNGGGAPAGGRGGGMRGGGMRGGGMGGGRAPHPAEADHEASVQDRMDANDTKAYLDGEGLLKDDQREHAREIASDFREKLYERRETLRAQAAAAK